MVALRDIDDTVHRVKPIRIRGLDQLVGKPVPPRDWLIDSVLVRRSISLLAGDGGMGKSLLCLQLQVAAALGLEWLGIKLPSPGMSSFGFYCEDDEDEIHRRLYAICTHYGVSFRDVGDMVRWSCRVGEDNELVVFKGRGDMVKAQKTALYDQLMQEILDQKHQLVIIDTAADAFAGNENIRPQVRSFVNLMRKLTIPNNGGLLLNAHPSKSAMADGSGFSGSTAWNGSVRNRLYLTKPRPVISDDDDSDGPTDERVLKVMKSNYSAFGQRIKCTYVNGAFVTKAPPAFGKPQFEKLEDDERVLKAAVHLVKRGTNIAAATNAPNRLSALAQNVKACRDAKMTPSAIANAQERLLESGKLVTVELGPPSKRRIYIRPFFLRYPGEEAAAAGGDIDPQNPDDSDKDTGDLLAGLTGGAS